MSNELCKCGKVGKISCPNDERCWSNNTLPAEVQEQIKKEADEYARTYSGTRSIKRPYIAGAIAYATKPHKEEGIIEKGDTKLLIVIDLLREVFQKHESGLLPDRFIYEKIKKFLYGEKENG